MGLPQATPKFTVDQYLAIERSSQERHEYVDGEIYAMAGESFEHGIITMNIGALLHAQLKGRPCVALKKDTKVRSGPPPKSQNVGRDRFSHPDVVVVCGDAEVYDEKRDVILNPKVIVEVLSPSTEAFDRGDKCNRYQTWNPSLTDYVIVSQDQPIVERFSRKSNGEWSFTRRAGLDATLPLPSIKCNLPLHEVYDRIAFGLPE